MIGWLLSMNSISMVIVARLMMAVARSVVTAVMTTVAPVSSMSSISMSMISLALSLNQGQVISLLRFILLKSLLVIQRQGSIEGSKQTELNIEISSS